MRRHCPLILSNLEFALAIGFSVLDTVGATADSAELCDEAPNKAGVLIDARIILHMANQFERLAVGWQG